MNNLDIKNIIFTDKAATRVNALIEKENNPNLKLRVYISGGGCAGFQYGFRFETNFDKDDIIIEKLGVTIIIDPMSYQYLIGCKVDFKEDLQGARFIVNNPNASTTCGCGSSFLP